AATGSAGTGRVPGWRRKPVHQLFPEHRLVADPAVIYDELVFPDAAAPLPGDGDESHGSSDRPYVVVNMVTTLDGRATAAGRVHELGSALDRRLMRKRRAAVDAVLRGADTVRPNPRFPGVPPEDAGLRRRKGLAHQPRLVIVSRSLELPRSEEHTSELQSRENLVCRLLLEKKE